MRRLIALFALLLGTAPAFAQNNVVKTENVRAELVSEAATVKPGEPFWVALRQSIRPHWHTYWKNPGDSGLPTEIQWTLPPGVAAESIVWPAPSMIDVGGVINYGYSDDVLLLVRITPAADYKDAKLPLAATANWLVCDDVCIPEEGKFTLDLPVGTAVQPASADTRALFDKARRNVPMPSPWPARFGLDKAGDPTLIVDARGLKPGYEQRAFPTAERVGALTLLASPDARNNSVRINTDADLYSAVLDAGTWFVFVDGYGSEEGEYRLRVSASVFNDGSSYRLLVSGLDTGTTNAITFGGDVLDLAGTGATPVWKNLITASLSGA